MVPVSTTGPHRRQGVAGQRRPLLLCNCRVGPGDRGAQLQCLMAGSREKRGVYLAFSNPAFEEKGF
jgi:hypothetical protein